MHGRPRLRGETIGLRTRGQPSYHLNADEFAHARFFFLEMDRGPIGKLPSVKRKSISPFNVNSAFFFNSHSCPACCTYCDLGSR